MLLKLPLKKYGDLGVYSMENRELAEIVHNQGKCGMFILDASRHMLQSVFLRVNP